MLRGKLENVKLLLQYGAKDDGLPFGKAKKTLIDIAKLSAKESDSDTLEIQRLILAAAKPPGVESGLSEAKQKLFQCLLPLLKVVRENYLTPLGDDEILNALQRGLPSALDPDSSYRSPAEYAEMSGDLPKALRAAVGLVLRMPQNAPFYPTVVSAINTPAARAGLRGGDRLLPVGETSLRGLPLEKVVTILRGSKGSTLNLGFERDGRRQEITLTRQLIRTQPLTVHALPQQVAYLRPCAFGYRTAKSFADQLAAWDKPAETERPQALVLDLRNHSGGTLSGAVAAAAAFLPRNALVARLQGRNKSEDNAELRATPMDYDEQDDPSPLDELPQHWKTIPLVALIDHTTASCAELLAAALRHHGRAKLVGESTLGVTAIRSLNKLPDGGALILPTARWSPPTGEPLTQGIKPDIAAIESTPVMDFGRLPQDTTLNKALEVLGKAGGQALDCVACDFDEPHFPPHGTSSACGSAVFSACAPRAEEGVFPVPLTVQKPTSHYNLEELRRGVECGDSGAMIHLGVRYQLGDGVPQDYKEVLRLYHSAFGEKRNKAAPALIGLMYENRLGVARDYKEAMRWYKLGHQRGSPVAPNNRQQHRQPVSVWPGRVSGLRESPGVVSFCG